jgi:hypothetical protein
MNENRPKTIDKTTLDSATLHADPDTNMVLSRVLQWLQKPNWTVNEAVAVTTGVFWPIGYGLGPLLLGKARRYRGQSASLTEAALAERRGYLENKFDGLDLSPQSPIEWIERSIDVGERPDWLNWAYNQRCLAIHLPKNNRQKHSKQREGGLIRHAGTLAQLVRIAIERCYENQFIVEPILSKTLAEFKKEMIDRFHDPDAPSGQMRPRKTQALYKNPKVRQQRTITKYVNEINGSQGVRQLADD